MALGRQKMTQLVQTVDVLGVKVADIAAKKAHDLILRLAGDKKGGHFVATVNSEFVMLARKNKRFAHILADADLALADGAGVVFSKLIFGGKVHERIAGVDLIEKLCAKSTKKVIRVGFLGGFGDIAEGVAKRQKLANPNLKVVFAGPGDPTISYDSRLKKQLLASGRIDILFVAYGMGKQEFWIERFKNKLNVGVFIGVGGALDYLAEAKMRAPRLVQGWGLEWLWRLVLEPWRIWRMRVLPLFLFLVLKKKFRKIRFSSFFV